MSDAENDHYHNEDKMQKTRIYITIPIVSEKGSFIYICEPLLLFPHWADFIRKNIASSAYPIDHGAIHHSVMGLQSGD